jgi:ankyrin repeat protein
LTIRWIAGTEPFTIAAALEKDGCTAAQAASGSAILIGPAMFPFRTVYLPTTPDSHLTVAELTVRIGTEVKFRERLATAESETVVYPVRSAYCGVVTELCVRPGQTVRSGAPLAIVQIRPRHDGAEWLSRLRSEFPESCELFAAVFEATVDEVRQRLAAGDDPNARSTVDTTPLFYALVLATKLPMAGALLAAGARVDVWSAFGLQPLHWVWPDYVAGASLLLDHGADVNAATRPARVPHGNYPVGSTPLHLAAAHGAWEHVAMVQLLLARGADPNRRDANGATPLHVAAARYRPFKRLIRTLLDGGADINAQTDDGRTALHLLAAGGGRLRKTVIRLLRQRGARANLRDAAGRLPIELVAPGMPSTELLRKLLRAS